MKAVMESQEQGQETPEEKTGTRGGQGAKLPLFAFRVHRLRAFSLPQSWTGDV